MLDPPAALVLGFFRDLAGGRQHWTIAGNGCLQRSGRRRAIASLPGSMLGLPGLVRRRRRSLALAQARRRGALSADAAARPARRCCWSLALALSVAFGETGLSAAPVRRAPSPIPARRPARSSSASARPGPRPRGAGRRGARAWPGAVMQGLLRNPLAEPGVLGVSAWSALRGGARHRRRPRRGARRAWRCAALAGALAAGGVVGAPGRALPRAGDADPVRRRPGGVRRGADRAGLQPVALAGDHGRGAGLAAGLGGQPRLERPRLGALIPMVAGRGALRLRRHGPAAC